MVLGTIFSIRYFYWRVHATMVPVAKWFFYLFLVAELLSFLETVLVDSRTCDESRLTLIVHLLELCWRNVAESAPGVVAGRCRRRSALGKTYS